MLKQKLAAMVFLIAGLLPVTAQNTENHTPKKKKQEIESLQRPFMMSLSLGPNFNTGGSEYSEWFGSRADVVTQFDWRMNVAFARHWCAYLNFGVTFFNVQTNDLVENIATALFDELFPGLRKIKPSISAGVTYIAEKGRWQFMPRTGIGWTSAGYMDETKKIDGKEYQFDIDRSCVFLHTGASIGYRTSNLCSVILDISYRYPLQACKAVYTTTLPDMSPVTETMKSRSWANDLSVSLGIQLQLELRKKK